jgi:two-component system, chemotaxis family, protein-glutamate methylesterase/glutaminase
MANSANSGSRYVIVVGTSAGGLSALKRLLAQFSEDFPVPILIVQHIPADAVGNVLIDTLKRTSKLKMLHPKSGESLLPGNVYFAASDHHLMIDEHKKILITKGAHENRSRPAINPLFRSAAVSYGSGVIGILLTGYLDDGTAGLEVIQRCGGICIVQDPKDADYPDMPQNAINKIKPDYILPIAEIGGIIYQLISKNPAKQRAISKDILIETAIATRVTSDLASVNALGSQVPFNCPGCGGVLWKVEDGAGSRFRCHTGHAYTASTLLAEQTMKIEETMWTALRMFEERKNLLDSIAQGKSGAVAKSARERSEATQEHIARIRQILLADDKGTDGDVPA